MHRLAAALAATLLVLGARTAAGEYRPAFMEVPTKRNKATGVGHEDDQSKRPTKVPKHVTLLKDDNFEQLVKVTALDKQGFLPGTANRTDANKPKPWLLVFGFNCPACKQFIQGPLAKLASKFKELKVDMNIGVLHVWHAPVTFEQFWITDIVEIKLQLGLKEYTFGRGNKAKTCCIKQTGCKDQKLFSKCWEKVEEELLEFIINPAVRGDAKLIRERPLTGLHKFVHMFKKITTALGWKLYMLIGLTLMLSLAMVLTITNMGGRMDTKKKKAA